MIHWEDIELGISQVSPLTYTLTAENIKAEIFDKGINTPEQICTGEYAEGCKALGITQ